jgi:hypothetical protein
MTANKATILKKLPKTFDRQFIVKMFTERNYSVSYADAVLEEFRHSGKIQRIARGRYKKIN